MYEYGIIHKVTNERDIIFGYWLEDAFRRNQLNQGEWDIEYEEYVD